jgi:hypothetical protein
MLAINSHVEAVGSSASSGAPAAALLFYTTSSARCHLAAVCAGIVAAAAASSPFDLGAAWERMAARFPFRTDSVFEYAVVLR